MRQAGQGVVVVQTEAVGAVPVDPPGPGDVAAKIARAVGKPDVEPEVCGNYRVGDIRHCFGDISKIERAYGFRPERDMNTGMEELINWVSRTKAPIDRSTESLAELTRGKLVV